MFWPSFVLPILMSDLVTEDRRSAAFRSLRTPTKEPSMHNIESPRIDDNGIEALIQAKGKTAARITPATIEANIASEHYFTAAQGVAFAAVGTEEAAAPEVLHLLTFCVLVLRNGFTVTGESACASPENFDADIGKKIARANAAQKIWPLMGYELRTKLAFVEEVQS